MLKAAVDAQAQIIVAQDVTQSAVDCGQLVPMIDAGRTLIAGGGAKVPARMPL
jgi:hypothetical protein